MDSLKYYLNTKADLSETLRRAVPSVGHAAEVRRDHHGFRHLSTNRQQANVELPQCRSHVDLQSRVIHDAYGTGKIIVNKCYRYHVLLKEG